MSLNSDVKRFLKSPMAGVDTAKTIVGRLDTRIKDLEKQLADLGAAATEVRKHSKLVLGVYNDAAEAVTNLLRELHLGDHPREASVAKTVIEEIVPKVRDMRKKIQEAHMERGIGCPCEYCKE